MGKFIVLLCFTLLAMTLVMACTPPGAICTSDADCCGGFICNRWAGRCTGGAGMNSAGLGGPWGPEGPEGAGVEWPQNEPAPAQ